MKAALYKKDLVSFFYSNSLYVVFIAYALLSAVMTFFWGEYLVNDDLTMRAFFVYQPQIMAIIIPAVTMRCWAEERKSGTIENLLTFPLSDTELMFSKFAASLTIAVMMMLFSLPLLITTAVYVPLDWGNVLSDYVGLFCVVCVLTAAGCLVSAMTAMPVIAYLGAMMFNVLWINLKLGSLVTRWWSNTPFYFREVLNFDANYQNFLNGQINPASLIYFLTFAGFLLLCNALVIVGWRTK